MSYLDNFRDPKERQPSLNEGSASPASERIASDRPHVTPRIDRVAASTSMRAGRSESSQQVSAGAADAHPFEGTPLVGGALALWALSALTVVIPWGLGRFLLRDAFFRPYTGFVFSTESRGAGTYFLSDYLAGLAVTTIVVGAVTLLASLWLRGHRIRRSILGSTLVAASIFVLVPQSSVQWKIAERATAQAEFLGVPGRSVSDCGEGSIRVTEDGIEREWHAFLVNESDGSPCRIIELWEGSRPSGNIAIPSSMSPVEQAQLHGFNDGGTRGTRFVYVGDVSPECSITDHCYVRTPIIGLDVDSGEIVWQESLNLNRWPGSSSNILSISVQTSYFVVLEKSGAVAIDPWSGQSLWRTECPGNEASNSLYQSLMSEDSKPGYTVLSCFYEDESTVNYRVADDGSLSIEST